MTRRKLSTSHEFTQLCNTSSSTTSDGQIRRSIMDVPKEVFVEILLKLRCEEHYLVQVRVQELAQSYFVSARSNHSSLLVQDNGCFYLMEHPEEPLLCRYTFDIDPNTKLKKIPLFNSQVMLKNSSTDQVHDDHIRKLYDDINTSLKPAGSKSRYESSRINKQAYFDFDNDQFGLIHSLPHDISGTTIGVLEEDCLCICDFTCDNIDIWHDRGLDVKDFHVCGDKFEFQAIAHTPSLFSLKDIIARPRRESVN
ncbi:hypothetical protein L484_007066 [Morus notabilis]|uniref:Uncharacterized protein n=1 Tax=Morus notabilis TaxID=981085 RepID=W9RTI7_9ROSA|nr:hypothetical protein L484_007066 [Morus notabilis]